MESLRTAMSDSSEDMRRPRHLYGRDSHLERLREGFERSQARQLLLVTGAAGMGKTALVESLQESSTLRVAFERKSEPCVAILQAIDAILPNFGDDERRRIREAIEDEPVLEELLPSMGKTLSKRRRLVPAVVRLLRAVNPHVLFFDDLQWADAASLEVLSLLLERPLSATVVIGAVRPAMVTLEHRLSVMLREVEAAQVTIVNIEVGPLEVADIVSMLQEAALPTEAASTIYAHTTGNPVLVKMYVMAMKDGVTVEGLGSPMQLIADRLQQVRPEVQRVLALAACLGPEFSVQVLNNLIDDNVEAMLRSLPDLVVDIEGDRWRFVSESGHASAYALLSEEEQVAAHVMIGRRLIASDENLRLVIDQFRRGVEALDDEEEKEQIAYLCLAKGERSAADSDFASAAEDLDFGIRLLGRRHWRDQYLLTLALFNAAAEVEHSRGNRARVDELLKEIFEHARSFSDRLRAYTVQIYVLGSGLQTHKAVELGLWLLKELGVELPSTIRPRLVANEYNRTRKLLEQKSDADILNSPRATDRNKLAAIRIGNIVFCYAFEVDPMLSQLIPFKLTQMMLEDGCISSMSCMGFTAMGMITITKFGNVDLGTRLSHLALDALEKFEAREWLTRTFISTYGFNFEWKYSVRAGLRPLLKAHRVGLERGDVEFAMFAVVRYSRLAVSLLNLSAMIDEMVTFNDLMVLYKQALMMRFLRPTYEFALCMAGRTSAPHWTNADFLDMDADLKKAVDAKLSSCWVTYTLLHKMMAAYYLGKYDKAQAFSMLINKCSVIGKLAPFARSTLFLFQGLLCLVSGKRSQRSPREAKCILNLLKELAIFRKGNIWSKVCLLEGELAACAGHLDDAVQKYNESAMFALKEGILADTGLALERAAVRLGEGGRQDEAATYWQRAALAYQAWGANAKLAIMHIQPEVLSSSSTLPFKSVESCQAKTIASFEDSSSYSSG